MTLVQSSHPFLPRRYGLRDLRDGLPPRSVHPSPAQPFAKRSAIEPWIDLLVGRQTTSVRNGSGRVRPTWQTSSGFAACKGRHLSIRRWPWRRWAGSTATPRRPRRS